MKNLTLAREFRGNGKRNPALKRVITPDKAVAICIQHDRSWLGDQLIGGEVASPPSGVTTESLRGRSTRQILHRYSGTGIDVFVALYLLQYRYVSTY